MPFNAPFKCLQAAIIGIVTFVCPPAYARPPAQPRPTRPTFIISHVSVVDVKAGRVLPDRTVTISGGRIMRIAASKIVPPGKGKVLFSSTVINGKGMFLMPGLFDSHVHLNNPNRDARMLVANGVTFVRDMGGATAERVAQRERARRGELFGLEMACVGTILDGDPPYHAWSERCGTPEQGRAAVRKLKASGVDQIKVYSLLKPEVHRAICDEAKRLKLKVVGHVPDALTLQEAVADGQQGVEHLSRFGPLLSVLVPDFKPLPDEYEGGIWARYPEVDKARLQIELRKMAAAGIAQCPTLILHAGQARILDPATRALWGIYALPDDRRGWGTIPPQYATYGRSLASAFPSLQQMVVELSRAGVPLLVGTDLANPGVLAGFGVHQEMRLWQEAGLRPVEVLRAATLAPARFLGVEDRLGAVEEGKSASLILTRRNPLLDVRNAAQIEAVFARGRYFSRAALDKFLAEAREDILARSPDPNRSMRLKLPGEVVARGRYNLFYEQYGDGSEEFLITRENGTYRFMAQRRQPGFGRFPLLQTGQWQSDFAPLQTVLDPFVLLPTVETYQIEAGRLKASAARKAKVVTRTTGTFAPQTALRSPLLASDYFLFPLLERLKLSMGETRRIETVLIGGSDGKPEPQAVNVLRHADETVMLSAGLAPLCRHYSLLAVKGSGARTDIWFNAEGIPVKQVLTEGGSKRSAVLSPPPAAAP
ncbi:MAG: amidohydrolase family protein [Cytophagales bacterium]|nr:amidohydrolase family protein [Armatimonadota bacterium]